MNSPFTVLQSDSHVFRWEILTLQPNDPGKMDENSPYI